MNFILLIKMQIYGNKIFKNQIKKIKKLLSAANPCAREKLK